MFPDSYRDHPGLRPLLDRIIIPKAFQNLENDHPARTAARTYALSLSLSIGPALIPILMEGGISRKRRSKLVSILRKELSVSGFAFAMTVAVGGGALIEYCWKQITRKDSQAPVPASSKHRMSVLSDILLRNLDLAPVYRTFICNVVTSLAAVLLLQSRRRSSPTHKVDIPLTVPISPPEGLADRKSPVTLDLTLLLLVRALDAIVQGWFLRRTEKTVDTVRSKKIETRSTEEKRLIRKTVMELTDNLDAFVFWAASARIMWCFFYRPERLPRSYVKWIGALANVDKRLLVALRRRREGTWAYGSEQSHTLLVDMAKDLGYSASWGDTLQLPARGGKAATEIWERLGVKGRNGVGGLPCELVHGGRSNVAIPIGVGSSCTTNVLARGGMGFLEGLALYIPVHLLPVLLTRPKELLSLVSLKGYTLSILRSSLFLSVFISSIWTAVCFTRTAGIARLFPRLSHNFIDGPFGCTLAGCLACGGSIWIEQGKRRGEIALYVLPRALRTLLSDSWTRGGSGSLKIMERLTFALSLAYILTASRHHPETLRGLSRWTVMFVTKGEPRSS